MNKNEIKLSGSLEENSLPAILHSLYIGRKTGILSLKQGSTQKSIYISNGYIVFASSNLVDDRLGESFLRIKKITIDQYNKSEELIKSTGKKHGNILVEMGAITPKELYLGVISQVKGIILSLFTWIDGDYSFKEGNLPTEEIITIKISSANLIVEGIRRISEWSRIKNGIGDEKNIFTVSSGPLKCFQDISLSVDEEHILSLVSGINSVKVICFLSRLGDFDTCKTLYGLLSVGIIELKETREQATNLEEHPLKEETKTKNNLEIEAERRKFLEKYNKMKEMDHYQILGLDINCSDNDIKKAFLRLAKEYHPDKHFEKSIEDIQEHLNEIFMKINEAYKILSDERERAKYNQSLRKIPTSAKEDTTQRNFIIASNQFKKGLSLLKNGEYWEAVDSLTWAVRLNSLNPNYQTYLGVALTRTKKRLHEAEEHCKTAIALDYSNPQYYINLGLVYKTGHLEKKAIQQFEEALKLDHKNKQALQALQEIRGK